MPEAEKPAETQIPPSVMTENKSEPLRLPTGISGLDAVLMGGLLKRATHLVVGNSGTGKTVLTQQIAFHHAQQGNSVLYLTFLSESHEKMINNTASFDFFDRELLGTRINYFSLYHEISRDGLVGLVAISRETVLKNKVNLVIVDGVSAMRDFATSSREMRKELFDLNAQLSILGCTVILIVDDRMPPSPEPEFSIADSIIWLHNETYERRHVRSIEVLKARGTSVLTGFHYFDISSAGIKVYPRTEALLADQELIAPPPPEPNQRQAFGVPGLDGMIEAGLLSNSVNVMLGTPGSGKTLTGLRFLYEGARQNEKCLLLSFQHPVEHVKSFSKQLGFDLTPYLENGNLQAYWLLPLKRHVDEIAALLIQAIEEYQPQRLFIDSYGDVDNLAMPSERLNEFWMALLNYLRSHHVTTLGTIELKQVGGNSLQIPDSILSEYSDTILFLRSLEIDGTVKRAISVLKMRDSSYDSRVREYLISKDGLAVGELFANQQRALGSFSTE